MSRYQSICFTIFDPHIVNDDQVCMQRAFDTGKLGFLIYQIERCPNTNREHIQGYAELHSRTTLGRHGPRSSGVKGIFRSDTMHVEMAKGSADQNITYCTKPESRVREGLRLGEPANKRPGERKDWEELYEHCIHADTDEKNLCIGHPVIIKYYRSATEIWSRTHPPSMRFPIRIFILVGPTRTGKTRWAFTKFPELYRLCTEKADWWNGYLGQKDVLIDEFDGESIKLTYMLQLLDRYPMQVPTKGGFVRLCATNWIITSNIDHDQWYSMAPQGNRDAFYARIQEWGRVLSVVEYREDLQLEEQEGAQAQE